MTTRSDLRPTTRQGRQDYVRNPRPIPHGTEYGYRRCRPSCDECRAAHAARRAAVRASAGGTESLGPVSQPGATICACGVICPSRTALGKHTWSAHDRWPTDAERTLLIATGQVAA